MICIKMDRVEELFVKENNKTFNRNYQIIINFIFWFIHIDTNNRRLKVPGPY